MALYKVTETRTITLTHVIEADGPEEARSLMADGSPKGLRDILEDDEEREYEVELY